LVHPGFEQHNQTQHAVFFAQRMFTGPRMEVDPAMVIGCLFSRDDPPLRPSTAASSTFSKVPGLWIEMGRCAKSPQNSLAPIGLMVA